MLARLIGPLVLLAANPLIFAQDDFDDDEFVPGLVTTYSSAGTSLQRIDDDVAFVWGRSSPDHRLPAGRIQALWQGKLMLKAAGTYRFYAHLQGKVSLRLDGQEVLSGTQAEPGWIRGAPREFDFGEFPLEVRFDQTEPAAQIKLYWSAERFELEPIPAHLLFHDQPRRDLNKIERGRVAFESHRCNRCHRRNHDPLSPAAPSLVHASGGLSRSWIVQKLMAHGDPSAHANMPQYGFDRKQAEDIAAFLLSGKPVTTKPLPKFKDDAMPLREGELLFRSVGCLACHSVGPHGNRTASTAGDLSQIGAKRSKWWLYKWLSEPEALIPDHRMPVFKLSKLERAQLATYLSQKGADKPATETAKTPNDAEAIERGRRLVSGARCANCHRIGGVEEDLKQIPGLNGANPRSRRSCLSRQTDPQHQQPAYLHADRDAIRAYLESRGEVSSAVSEFERGRRVLRRKNCLRCHERGLQPGIVATAGAMSRHDESLQGQSEALIPPSLTAVGDKLLDESLKEAVGGNQQRIRLPWLKVRMPKFRHTAAEERALLAYLIGHDRISDRPRDAAPAIAADEDATQTLIAGHELVGGKGFSCVACHAFGKFEPRNVALGTRGSDLLQPGRRMRKEFFLRWTRAPLRIVPGMEMPSFEKPVPGILDGDHGKQLAAIWDALNDPNFTVPTNPAVVEQYFVVRPGEQPRIVRDVFTNHDADGGHTARSFAVGLPNQHNVLFDLDTFSLRQWWLGDFARQRTQGKSWFWDAAGVTITAGSPNRPDIVLRKIGNGADDLIEPRRSHGVHGRLLGYSKTKQQVRFQYQLDFGDLGRFEVTETLRPLDSSQQSQRTGWTRRIAVSSIPQGYQAVVRQPDTSVKFGDPSIEILKGHSGGWETDGEGTRMTRLATAKTGKSAATFAYTTALRPEKLRLNPPTAVDLPVEKITAVPGYEGVRLPLPRSIMPTAISWTADGKLVFTSLKGHVYLAVDTDGDEIEDELQSVEEGLAAPYGVIADGPDLIVAHKPELLRLRDTDGDGEFDRRQVVATGWGYNDNYHDWTTGIVRDSSGNLYVGLGSDYAQKKRAREHTRWRGTILRISPSGKVEPVAHDLRYPTGLAIDQFDRVFMSDQQGVQNTFNEVNYLIPGRGYGVTSPHRESPDSPAMWPAVQLPHPWTRSVNGIFFLNPQLVADPKVFGPFAGHGIGCEYDTRALIRFTTQQVGDVLQGAAYRFSRPQVDNPRETFVGALCGAVAPSGDIYVGSIHDSGWLGGHNLGDIVKLRPTGKLPLGIQELRATPQGFELTFTAPVNRQAAAKPENYTISGYTRVWKGGYATLDSGRHQVPIQAADVSADGRTVLLHANPLKPKFVFEVGCRRIGPDPKVPLWPAVGYYTMTTVPK